MRFLTPNFWAPIMKADKGQNFEDLVEDLLKEIHPNVNWSRTPKSHDGKKDFIVTIPIEAIGDHKTYWVECKNYENAISINTLSPTLVMAVIKNTNGIFFFSYSRLNNNAEDYLFQFAEKVGKTIFIFDDLKLETEILKHPVILQKHFPSFHGVSYNYTEQPKIVSRVKFNRDITHSYGTDNSFVHQGAKVLQVNETFCIDVFIQNCLSNPLRLKLRLHPKEFQDHFSLLNRQLVKCSFEEDIRLAPAGSYFKRIVFRLEHYAVRIQLPKVYIIDERADQIELNCGDVYGRWIINAPLIGSQYLKVVDDIRNVTSYRNTPLTYCIFGESGTGKSRLLKEITDSLTENGYSIYTEDSDFGSNKRSGVELLKRIISQISGLPVKRPLTDTKEVFGGVNDWNESKAAEFLYSADVPLSDAGYLQGILDLFFNLTTEKAVAILIDNVQFFDEDLSTLVNAILNESSGTTSRYLLVLSFNTDFLYPQTKAFHLFEHLKQLTKEKPTQFFLSEIRGFQDAQMLEYIEHCIPTSTEFYPETFRAIIRKTGNFPLYIEQMLHHLSDNNAISKSGDFFFINDIIKLNRLVEELPGKLTDLIKQRWAFILASASGSEIQQFLKFIALFQKLPRALAIELGLTETVLDTLVSIGILEITQTEQIVFHHSQLLHFFNSQLINTIDPALAESGIMIIEKFDLSHQYPAQYYILRNTIKPNDPDVLKFGAECLLNESVSIEYKVRFDRYLYNSLKLAPQREDIPTLKLYTKICDDIKMYVEFSSALSLFEEIYHEKFVDYKRYLSYGEDFYHFILRYVNSYLSVHQDKNAHGVLLSSLNVIEEFEFSSELSRNKAKSELLNRLCVTYKSLNEPEQAESAANESLELSLKTHNKSLTIKNYIDKGYIYYKNTIQKNDLLMCWGTAWHLFDKEYEVAIEQRRVSALHHKALFELINNNRDEALTYAKEALRCADRKLDVFNKIKIMLTIVIIRFLQRTNDFQRSEIMIREAIDLCVSSNSVRSYWTSWHLLGKISTDPDIKHFAYSTSLKLLHSFIVNERMEGLYQYFYDDLAVTMRHLRYNAPDEIQKLLSFITNTEIKAKVKKVLKMNDEDFRNYSANFKPSTPISDGRSNFPLP